MRLSETWFIEDYIDFELQKYKLLAYLQEVNKHFNETKLYPQLADIIFHYNNLVSFRENKRLLQDNFPRTAEKIDTQKLEIVYKQMLEDNELMKELEHIIQYAIPNMKATIESGAELYEMIEKQVFIEPVGLLPLYKKEGYVLLRYDQLSEVRAYNYTITLFEHEEARYRGVRMNYLQSWASTVTNTYNQIKRDIIKLNKDLPTPAVYRIESSLTLPFSETLLPIAKRMLVRYIDEA